MGKLDEMLGEVWEPVILSFANKKSGWILALTLEDQDTQLASDPGHPAGRAPFHGNVTMTSCPGMSRSQSL